MERKGRGRAHSRFPRAETPSGLALGIEAPGSQARTASHSSRAGRSSSLGLSFFFLAFTDKTQHRLTLQSICGLAEIHISPGSLFFTFRLVKFGNPSSFLCDTGRQQSHERV